jgi:Ni,Fe-hydrogenase III small subunit/Pyruvate/2-oxoacid:ferredoxin oxidoreductase delta subunit
MLDSLLARFQQKHRTMTFPDGPPPELPDRYMGRPIIAATDCTPGCSRCVEICPTGAITHTDGISLDIGACLFCGECARICPSRCIHFTKHYDMAVRQRDELRIDPSRKFQPADALDRKLRRLFGRSLKLRQVSAGGCNACEADTNVLGTVGWDLGRFGIQFVASPRHADGLLITGPVPKNMNTALMKTYDAVPAPKIVIAVGACAVSGGPYRDNEEVLNGTCDLLPVDLLIPGCPPHPLTILDGLLRLVGRIQASSE